MQPVRQLVRVKHGSHLYGTSTPQSDQDFKGVHLPSGAAIILQRAENVIDDGVKSKAEGTNKNDADAIDSQSFSVQKFYEMLMKGDTVATEILFAPRSAMVQRDPLWDAVQTTGMLLLNRQCKGFVGYCVRQAAKYGIKGSRMAAVKSVVDHLDGFIAREGATARLSTVEVELHNWSTDFIADGHVSWENIPNPNGSDSWHLNVCDRKMPMTATIGTARDMWAKIWENYGERARQAMTNDGIDWKAVSHAVRVAQQAIELLDTGKITFPRPNAGYLLQIKRGELPYAGVSKDLEDMVAAVQLASQTSRLPEKSDHKLADRIVRQLYLGQVRE